MLANTTKLYVIFMLFIIGLVFSLILLYANPKNIPEVFDASLFSFGSALAVFAVVYRLNFEMEKRNIVKYLYLTTLVLFTILTMVLVLIAIYANPTEAGLPDYEASMLFGLAGFFYVASFVRVLFKKGALTHA